MSLILDALKKSEQERRRERGPDLQTIHQASAASTRAPRNHGVWIAALIAVNAIAVGGWWWSQRGAGPAPAADTVVASPVEPVASVPASPTPIARNEPASVAETVQPQPQDEAQFTRIEPRPDAAQPRLSAHAPVEEFSDLPPDVRSSLPAMTFSFHVYSTDARNRTIIINNQRLREGDDVSAGVSLESITEDGVILAMDHRRVHINVLTGW
jgi:general secretion pathway protein B